MICTLHQIADYWADQIKEGEMGAVFTARRGKKICKQTRKRGDHLKDTGVDGSRPIIINWISRETVLGNVDWVYLAQDRDRKWAIEHSNKTSGSIKYRKYLDWLGVKLGSQGLFSIVSTECRFRVLNTLAPYLRGTEFKSRTGDRLS
jgi:hypothetical protein